MSQRTRELIAGLMEDPPAVSLEADKLSTGQKVGIVFLGAVAAINLGIWLHEKFQLFKSRSKPPTSEEDFNKLAYDARKGTEACVAQIRKYYTNDDWLNKQEFVSTKINGERIAGSLAIGDKIAPNLETAVKKHIGVVESFFSKYVQARNEYVAKINLIGERLSKSEPDQYKNACKKAADEVKKVKQPFQIFHPSVEGMLGNPLLVLDYGIGKHYAINELDFRGLKTAPELEPLGKDGVKKTAELLIVVLEAINKIYTEASKCKFTYDGEDDTIFQKPSREHDDLWQTMIGYHELSDAFFHTGQEHIHCEVAWMMERSVTIIATSLLQYITSSIKK